jgi:uncharacterized YigZ family protein
MYCVLETTHNKIEVKKSTFTSYLLPYSLFENYHDSLKQEHPKASHIIWAFRYLNAHGQIVEGGSDDGEPKGVAATPTLNVLRGHELINTALLTVRYFGGTKLGTGGMVRAYGNSAKEVIMISNLTPFEPTTQVEFETSYTISKRYEHFFDTHDIAYHDREFKTDCIVWKVTLTQKERVEFEAFIASLG